MTTDHTALLADARLALARLLGAMTDMSEAELRAVAGPLRSAAEAAEGELAARRAHETLERLYRQKGGPR